MAWNRPRVAAAAIVSVVAIVLVCLVGREWGLREMGAELFDGRRALVASVQGQELVLPPFAVRCVNCHDLGPTATDRSASAPLANFGPAISGASVAADQARRGGPPSHFNASTLCRLLRTGVDPSDVLVTRAMPRYRISDAQCNALWEHLSHS